VSRILNSAVSGSVAGEFKISQGGSILALNTQRMCFSPGSLPIEPRSLGEQQREHNLVSCMCEIDIAHTVCLVSHSRLAVLAAMLCVKGLLQG
jgi:hypothetical protein